MSTRASSAGTPSSTMAHFPPGTSAYGGPEVPKFVQYTSPVSTAPRSAGGPHVPALPLNLIALIVSFLDDIGDLARVTRTSRLLYYMALPTLYQKVHLHSYADIRYVNGRPEGFGSGSPFTMALDGLVTKAHASLVQDFRVWGNWKSLEEEDFGKGRVPDNSMMLNILMRAAVDKMTKLRFFNWELDCKPLKTLYQGLSMKELVSLTVKFPSTRTARPASLIPPILTLRAFKATDIDPLCYPDDISSLLLGSKKLEDLRLHFSPRMRREAEPTVNLQTIFGRCQKAGYTLRLKHFAMENFFGQHSNCFDCIMTDTWRSATFIDTFGGSNSSSKNVFGDESWKFIPVDVTHVFRELRCNEMTHDHVKMLRRGKGVEKMYFINARHPKTGDTPLSPHDPITPEDSESPPNEQEILALGRDYVHALTRNHGPTLKHLLLSDQWYLGQEEMSDIVRFCPNLEQLGIALNSENLTIVRLLMPFLPNMVACRLLHNSFVEEHLRIVSHAERMEQMSRDLANACAPKLKWVGIGNEVVYKVCGLYDHQNPDGSWEKRRHLEMVPAGSADHIDIWRLDCLNIDADTGALPSS